MSMRNMIGGLARSLQSLALTGATPSAPLAAARLAAAPAVQREMTTAKSRARKLNLPGGKHPKHVIIQGHIERGQRQKIWFPNTIIQFMPNQQYNEENELTCVKFRVPPSMNKREMKSWIESAYDTPVEKVNTSNREGRVKRVPGKPQKIYRRSDFKVAYVYLDGKWKPPVSDKAGAEPPCRVVWVGG